LHGDRPSFGLFFAAAALANIPFWIFTGIFGYLSELGILQLEGFIYVILLFVLVLFGGMAGGQFLTSRLDGVGWHIGMKAALAASLVNVFFSIGTFSIDYAHFLTLILVGFFLGGPIGALIGTKRRSPRKAGIQQPA